VIPGLAKSRKNPTIRKNIQRLPSCRLLKPGDKLADQEMERLFTSEQTDERNYIFFTVEEATD